MNAVTMPSPIECSRHPDAHPSHPRRLSERSAMRVAADAAIAGVLDSVPAAAGSDLSVLRRDARSTGSRQEPGVANYLFSGFSVFAVMGPALFGVGCVLAIEREAGVLKLKRALPAPGGAHLIAKATMAMVFAGAAMMTCWSPESSPARSVCRRRNC